MSELQARSRWGLDGPAIRSELFLPIHVDVGGDGGGAYVEAGGELRDSVDLVEHRGHGRIEGQLRTLEPEGVSGGLEWKSGAGGQGDIEEVVAAPDCVVDDHLAGK